MRDVKKKAKSDLVCMPLNNDYVKLTTIKSDHVMLVIKIFKGADIETNNRFITRLKNACCLYLKEYKQLMKL